MFLVEVPAGPDTRPGGAKVALHLWVALEGDAPRLALHVDDCEDLAADAVNEGGIVEGPVRGGGALAGEEIEKGGALHMGRVTRARFRGKPIGRRSGTAFPDETSENLGEES